MNPHKISTYSAHSENCYFHFFYPLSDWVENFVRFHKILFQTDAETFSFLSDKTKKFYSWNKYDLGCSQYQNKKALFTGRSMSEALIFASTNPQYDNGLFIELPVQYMGENMMRT